MSGKAGGPQAETIAQESARAAAGKPFSGEQPNAQIDYSALATAALVNSSLAHATGPQADAYKDLSAKLSSNTLSAWSKGAMLATGDAVQCNKMLGAKATKMLFVTPDGDLVNSAAAAKTAVPSAFLRELRRKYGNDWGSAMKMAEFIKAKQDEALHKQVWDSIPGTVPGWDPHHRGWQARSAELHDGRWPHTRDTNNPLL
jgi:hypothetical protein